MNERHERIERLLERYFEAQTTDAEERELRDYFLQERNIPASLRYAQTLFCGLESLSAEQLPERSAQEVADPAAHQAQPVVAAFGRTISLGRRLASLWGVAAAVAVLLGIFFYTEYTRKPYCYIDGVAIYDKEVAMQTTVYLESFSALDESARMVDELIRNN